MSPKTTKTTTNLSKSSATGQLSRLFIEHNQHLRFQNGLDKIDGYAFSQEEGGAVTQTDVIRAYDTNLPKPDGK